MPVGPLSLNDEVALDLALADRPGDEGRGRARRPWRPAQEELLARLVEGEGRLGRKNRKGFYDYPENGPKRLWPGLADLQRTRLDPDRVDFGELKSRLLVAQALEAARTVAEGVDHRSARGRCRLDPRLRLRPVHGRRPVLHRRDGGGALRRAVRDPAGEARRALRPAPDPRGDGGNGRNASTEEAKRSGRPDAPLAAAVPARDLREHASRRPHVPHDRLLLLARLPLGLYRPRAVHGGRRPPRPSGQSQADLPRPRLRRDRRAAARQASPRPPALPARRAPALAREAGGGAQPPPEALAVRAGARRPLRDRDRRGAPEIPIASCAAPLPESGRRSATSPTRSSSPSSPRRRASTRRRCCRRRGAISRKLSTR